jgi:hypothetical protein
MRVFFFATAVTFIAGCQTETKLDKIVESDPGPYPTNYREVVKASYSTLYKDPYSVRDAIVYSPFRSGDKWSVCLLANAKNGYGAYTGIHATLIYIKNSRVVSAYPDPDGFIKQKSIDYLCTSYIKTGLSGEPL